MKELLEKTREYLNYVERHYNNVQKAWKEIIKHYDKLNLSKEEFTQYRQYRQYFYPTTSYETKDRV